MHRVARHHASVVAAAGKANAARGWSVLSRPCAQRTLSTGGGSASEGGGKDDAPGGQQEERGVGAQAGAGNQQPGGRGGGAFSRYLRVHERKIKKQLRRIDEWSEGNRTGDSVSGQFDDSETDSDGKSSATKIPDELRAMFEPKQPYDEESQRSSSQDDDWQEKWFSHEDERMDLLGSELTVEEENELGGDYPELDDCEEDDHFDPESAWDDEVWAGFTPEDIEQFVTLGARLEQEETEQMADLRQKWEQTKEESIKQHGTCAHLELPDIVITHEMTYDAPPGKAHADRPMPLPRTLETIVDSMQLPPGLDVTPGDPEYEQVVNMWMSVSRNNTMDEKMKKNVIGQICTFIAKRRNSDAFQKALEVQDFPEERGQRPR